MNSQDAAYTFTVFDSIKPDCLTKTFSCVEGSIRKESGGEMVSGRAAVETAPSLRAFQWRLDGLASHQAVGYGICPEHPSASVVTARAVPRHPGAISRTRAHFQFPAGPGIWMLDFDGVDRYAMDLIEVVRGLAPALADTTMLWRPSASLGVYPVGGAFLPGGGQRLYIGVDDASLIPEAGEALVDLAWAAGLGHIQVSKSGAKLARCIVDSSVWQPERLDFAAPPRLGEGVGRWSIPSFIDPYFEPDEPEQRLDLRELIGAVTQSTAAVANGKRQAALRAAEDNARTTRAAWAAERAPAFAERAGVSEKGARTTLERAAVSFELPPDLDLRLQSGDTVTVREVASDPARWRDERLADPLEPDYRGDDRVAVVCVGADGMPFIYSHAHGGIRYRFAAEPAPATAAGPKQRTRQPTAPAAPAEARRSYTRLATPLATPEDIDEFYRRHATVMIQGMAVIAYREYDRQNHWYVTRLATDRSMTLQHKRLKMLADGKVVELYRHWLDDYRRAAYPQIVFEPRAGLVAGSVDLPDEPALNIYQGLTFQPEPGDCSRLLAHIHTYWCRGDQALYEYVIGWLARLFQKPEERGHTVLLLKSGEGTGKNVVVDVLQKAFGAHSVLATRPDDLVGRFNDDLGTAILVFANEAFWGGDKSLEGVLKAIITDETIPVERKGYPKYRTRNCTHLIMASNNDWAAPIGLDDRRFVVIDMDESKRGDFEYFRALQDEIRNGGDRAFVHHLMDVDISRFNPRKLPAISGGQTSKFDMKLRGASSVVQWWYGCVDSGEIVATVSGQNPLPPYNPVTERLELARGWESGSVAVTKQALYDAYLGWCRARGSRIEGETGFGKTLARFAGASTNRVGPKTGPRPRSFCFGRLQECREHFERAVCQAIDWGEGE